MSNKVIPPYTLPRPRTRQLVVATSLYLICSLIGFFYGFVSAVFPPEILTYTLLPVALLGLIVLWVMPDNSSMPTNRVFFLFFGFLLSYAIWPDYLGIKIGGLPVISLRRLFALPLAVVILIAALTSPGFRRQMSEVLMSAPVVWKGILILTALQFITYPMAANKFHATNSMINSIFFWTTIFFAGSFVFSFQQGRDKFLRTLFYATSTLLLVSIIEFIMKARPWAEIVPVLFGVNDGIIEAMTPIYRDGIYRVTTVFRVSLSYAEYLALVSPFVLHRVMYSSGFGAKAFWLAFDVAIFVAAVATQARLGIVCFLVGHAAYGIIWSLRRWRLLNRADLIAPALVLAMVCGSVALVTSMFTVNAVRVRTIGGGSSALSDQGRREQWKMGLPKIAANPIGYGAGQGGQTLNFVTAGGKLTIDSYALTILLEYGVLGFLTYVVMFGWTIFRLFCVALKRADTNAVLALPIISSLMVWLTSKTVLSQSENDPLAFMLLALAINVIGTKQRLGRAELDYMAAKRAS